MPKNPIYITRIPANAPRDVLREQYPGEFAAQPVYIRLDLRDGEVDVWVSPNTGSWSTNHYGLVRHYGIPLAEPKKVNSLMSQLAPILQQVYDGSSVESGDTHRYGVLTPAGELAEQEANDIVYRWGLNPANYLTP